MIRITDDRWTKQIPEWIPWRHKQPQRRPPTRWPDIFVTKLAIRSSSFIDSRAQLTDDTRCEIDHRHGRRLREKGKNGKCVTVRNTSENGSSKYPSISERFSYTVYFNWGSKLTCVLDRVLLVWSKLLSQAVSLTTFNADLCILGHRDAEVITDSS